MHHTVVSGYVTWVQSHLGGFLPDQKTTSFQKNMAKIVDSQVEVANAIPIDHLRLRKASDDCKFVQKIWKDAYNSLSIWRPQLVFVSVSV